MISVLVKKGHELHVAGKPSQEIETLKKPDSVALLPEKIPFIKPRLKIKVGDRVKIGSTVFEDKRNPDIKFVSPGGGEITDIHFGPRRIIKKIVVKLDREEAFEDFSALDETEIEIVEKFELIKAIMSAGLWPLFRQLPFRNIADPNVTPPAIIVSLNSIEPFQPSPAVYLTEKAQLFDFGITILKRLSDTVIVSSSAKHFADLDTLSGYVTHLCKGPYPADDPGVLVYHTKTDPAQNTSWFIDGQDVLLLASFLKTGKYPIERTISVGGVLAPEKKHFRTRAGVPLRHLTQRHPIDEKTVRYIVGGILSGYADTGDSYAGFYETSLLMIPRGAEKEFFGFIRPGFNKPSRSRAFLSYFNPSDLPMDATYHGEERACINCGYCTDVCPVDILPQFTYKSILADEIEEALAHGLLDCVECGLCSYVCPSKIELFDVLKTTKMAYYLEQL
ncbi:MAG: 4Fe-4S dicluster domain-containing protein [Desulfobacterales bacterium]|nr:MAG: 4Fe-4S dicluster domain-containing protein [Desulfobacterales bacterium]